MLPGDGPGESKIKLFIQNNNLCILIISFIPISNLSEDVDVFPSSSGAEIRETHYSICHGLYQSHAQHRNGTREDFQTYYLLGARDTIS